MRLLLDQNLSPRLVARLADVFPDATHVEFVGLSRAPDQEVWAYARSHGCIIVTKDTDFTDLSVLYGSPPKVIRVGVGTCTTTAIVELLRRHHPTIIDFVADPEVGSLTIV